MKRICDMARQVAQAGPAPEQRVGPHGMVKQQHQLPVRFGLNRTGRHPAEKEQPAFVHQKFDTGSTMKGRNGK